MGEQRITEAKDTDSRLALIRKLLAKAESTDSEPERVALNERAAQLIAQYGISRAMLAADGKQGDEIVDLTFMIGKPFSAKFVNLLWSVAGPLKAKARSVKQWNPELKGGRKKGGYEYGLRLFAFSSDMARIEMLYASLRNQAIAGMLKVVDRSSDFGQTQKADRESYLDGFNSAVYWRLERAERDAEKAAEAERQKLADEALLAGIKSGPGVALVLADRSKQLDAAMDLANGITPEKRARWAAQDAANNTPEMQAARQAAWEAEKAACPRCKRGRPCTQHGTARGRSQSYERVGSRWSEGYIDGQRAALGDEKSVGTGRQALED